MPSPNGKPMNALLKRLAPWWPELAIVLAVVAVLLAVPLASPAAAVFLAFMAPGLQAARWLTAARQRTAAGPRLQAGLGSALLVAGLSLALAPIAVYWAGSAFGFIRPVAALALGGASLALGLLARLGKTQRLGQVSRKETGQVPASSGTESGAARRLDPLFDRNRDTRWFVVLLLGLAALVALPLIQVRTQAGLFEPGVSDWAKHYTVTWLIEETGLPPRHLLYPPWQDHPFVYYYFFHLLVATLRLLSAGAVSILTAYITTTLVICLTFVGLVALLARQVSGRSRPALLSALFVSVVGGLELLPLAAKAVSGLLASGLTTSPLLGLTGGLDCRAGPIPSPYAAYIWAPHHVAAGVVFLVGLVLISLFGRTRRLAVLAPLLIFAVAGYSVYVAMPVVVALGVYAVWDVLAAAASGRRALVWAGLAAATLAVSLPYLLGLLSTRTSETAGIVLHVPPGGASWLDGAVFAGLVGDSWLSRLLDTPLHYLIDVGAVLVFGLLGWCVYLKTTRSTTERPGSVRLLALAAVFALALAVLFTSRGAVLDLGCNDLRSRGVLPLQIALAVAAGLGLELALARRRRPWALALLALLLIGVVSTAWTVAERGLIRFLRPPAVSAEALAAYQFIRDATPADAVFQGDVGAWFHRDRPLHLYAGRVSRVETGLYPLLHVPQGVFGQEVREVAAAFRSQDSAEAWRLLSGLGVEYVFVGPEERQGFAEFHPSGELRQFDNRRYFELVYDGSAYQVYRVMESEAS